MCRHLFSTGQTKMLKACGRKEVEGMTVLARSVFIADRSGGTSSALTDHFRYPSLSSGWCGETVNLLVERKLYGCKCNTAKR